MIRCSFKIRNAFFFHLSQYHQSVDKGVMFLHGSKQLHTAFTPLVFLAVEDVEVLDFLFVNAFACQFQISVSWSTEMFEWGCVASWQ